MTRIECMVKDCEYNDNSLPNGGVCKSNKVEIIYARCRSSGLECLTEIMTFQQKAKEWWKEKDGVKINET